MIKRLHSTPIQAGDVLLMQGPADALAEFAGDYGCVPLAHREITIPDKRRATLASLFMGGAIIIAALGWLPANIAFALGVLLFILFRVVPPREAYDAVIGSGPAGQKAAIAAAKLGKTVALIDRRAMLGGVSLHGGTIPSKTLREAVLYLSGFEQRAFYGKQDVAQEGIRHEDLKARVRLVEVRETRVIQDQLICE